MPTLFERLTGQTTARCKRTAVWTDLPPVSVKLTGTRTWHRSTQVTLFLRVPPWHGHNRNESLCLTFCRVRARKLARFLGNSKPFLRMSERTCRDAATQPHHAFRKRMARSRPPRSSACSTRRKPCVSKSLVTLCFWSKPISRPMTPSASRNAPASPAMCR